MDSPILSYGDKLYDILVKINNSVSVMLLKAEGNYINNNEIGIEKVDISDAEWFFDVTILGDKHRMSCTRLIKYILGDVPSSREVQMFINRYNRILKYAVIKSDDRYSKVEVPEFKYDPKNVRNTFLSLTTKTYPHGTEEDVLKYLPNDLKKDPFGNYYKIIGNSTTMFTSHLDTADRKQENVNVYTFKDNNDDIFLTDSNTILGADDKAGVTVMLYMMSHNIPGIYYFFIGEERGGIGSSALADEYETFEFLDKINKCVSFDRRNYYSVITSQLGRVCCSDGFANALCKELNKSNMKMSIDNTGIYTDSASFMSNIPECTNISVGYFNEHTGKEMQNISFLERLCKACLDVNWEALPIHRRVGLNSEFVKNNKNFILDFKKTPFKIEAKLVSEYNNTYIKSQFDESDIIYVYEDLVKIDRLLRRHKLNTKVTFDYQYMKIKLD